MLAGELCIDAVSCSALAQKYGTPLYVYSAQLIRSRFLEYQKIQEGMTHLVCFAVKACPNLSILRLLGEMGAGADIVSLGELKRAQEAGIPTERIVFSGVGKTRSEIKVALEQNILLFNVESESELQMINQVALEQGKKAPINLRLNPDIKAGGHRFISTASKTHKFGITEEQILAIYERAKQMPGICIMGVSCHLGSQILKIEPYARAAKKVGSLCRQLQKMGIQLSYIDGGGGIGIQYKSEKPVNIDAILRSWRPLIKQYSATLITEPGRYLLGPAGILITEVLHLKRNHKKDFVIVDAGMNDLIRPSFYAAHHEIVEVCPKGRKFKIVDVVGPVCESSDFFALNRRLPEVQSGELLAVKSVGAYGYSMSSQYNSRPRVAEVLVDGAEYKLIRRRETYDDLVRAERDLHE